METEKDENKKSTKKGKKIIFHTRAYKREVLQKLFDENITGIYYSFRTRRIIKGVELQIIK